VRQLLTEDDGGRQAARRRTEGYSCVKRKVVTVELMTSGAVRVVRVQGHGRIVPWAVLRGM
jgi:membrane-bound inhibitor of C-type lysozyme